MTDPYEALAEAEKLRSDAEKSVLSAHNKIEQIEKKLREALPIGENVPCTVAVLPSGQIAVHVWVASASNPNQLHIVSPGYFDEDGVARIKFPGERLGR